MQQVQRPLVKKNSKPVKGKIRFLENTIGKYFYTLSIGRLFKEANPTNYKEKDANPTNYKLDYLKISDFYSSKDPDRSSHRVDIYNAHHG